MSDDDVETLGKDIVADKKQEWRMQQITDEGNDPSTSNQKAGENGPEDLGGGGEGGGGLPDLGGEEGGGGGDEELPELPPLEEAKEKVEAPIDEETRKQREEGDRDQTGDKEKYISTFDKTRGEDPLGDKQNKEKSKTERETKHTYRNAPMSLQEELKTIKLSLRSKGLVKKQIIVEKQSMLDESNIIQEGVVSAPVIKKKSMLDESNILPEAKPL